MWFSLFPVWSSCSLAKLCLPRAILYWMTLAIFPLLCCIFSMMLKSMLTVFYASKSMEYFSPSTYSGLFSLWLFLTTNCATSPIETKPEDETVESAMSSGGWRNAWLSSHLFCHRNQKNLLKDWPRLAYNIVMQFLMRKNGWFNPVLLSVSSCRNLLSWKEKQSSLSFVTEENSLCS